MRKILAAFAALTLVLGLSALFAPAASAAEECVPQDAVADSYTDWADEGQPTATKGTDTSTERWVLVSEAADGYWDDTTLTFYTWTGGPFVDAPPVYSDDTKTELNEGWNATSGKPQGKKHKNAEIRVPYNVSNKANDEPGLGSWFLKSGVYVPAQDALWQKQVREFVPGTPAVECPDEPVDPQDPKDPEEPNTPQNKPPTELPGTGASDVLPWAGLGLVVLLSGLLTHMVITRRSKSLI